MTVEQLMSDQHGAVLCTQGRHAVRRAGNDCLRELLAAGEEFHMPTKGSE